MCGMLAIANVSLHGGSKIVRPTRAVTVRVTVSVTVARFQFHIPRSEIQSPAPYGTLYPSYYVEVGTST